MKLFYYIPDGHGSASFFVLAASAEDAAKAVNAKRRAEMDGAKHPDEYYWHDRRFEFTAENFEVAEVGEVIDHPNS